MSSRTNQFKVKRLGKEDVASFRALIQLFQDVFEMKEQEETTEQYLETLLARPEFIVLVILHEGEIAGGLTAWEMQMYYGEYAELFIYDVAIRETFQRKGLGRQLLSSLKTWCKEQGIREFFVAANEEDEHALKFYLSTGGMPEKAVHFNYAVK